ncbi:FAD-dependent oxidoreductase [Neorhizobium sp. DAR64860/K0K1]|uniref:oxidoreductase n=1 Tax=Neorhizobium sp. DAR64860/K0K1 TaxID=3421955 RepID=UPI003D2C4831
MQERFAETEFSHAMAPLAVGNLTFRNRILVPAHTTNFGENHLPSERHLAYHRERARGGVGAIIFESIRVHANSLGRPQAVCGFDPACIEPFRRITEAVKAEGARILGQIIHLGRQVEGDFERTVSWGPSPIAWATSALPPRPMDRADMDAVIEGHVLTARHLMAAGFEGIELQMAHGHLLQQFLSPLSNNRDDAYGGSAENRMRFPLEVLQAVRAEVGRDFCLGIRLSGDEYVEGGITIDQAERTAVSLAAAEKIDFFNVSHSAYHASYSLASQMADMAIDPEPFRSLPARIRIALRSRGHDIPVFAVCRFNTLAEADAIIAAGGADAVGMARAHLAEPAIVNKTVEGRMNEIGTCIACNQGCAGMLEKNLPIRCLVNPRAGLEGVWPELATTGTRQPKRLLVVGGGPAGLEAARTAAERGHIVTLWEKQDDLGGQFRDAVKMPKRAEFRTLMEEQIADLDRFGVTVITGKHADAGSISDFAADAVFLATGSTPVRTEFAGGGKAFTIVEALDDPAALGSDVALFDRTGEWAALTLAEHLADLGKKVTFFSPAGGIAWRTTIYSTLANLKRLREKKVRIATLRKVTAFDGKTLAVEDLSTGESELHMGFTGLVAAEHNFADQSLFKQLRHLAVPVRQIGDNLAPRTALEAVYHGHLAAREL